MPYTGVPLRLAQMIADHHAALDRLETALTEPLRAIDTFAALYRRPIAAGEFGLALAEAYGHLNHLHQTGRALRWLDETGAWRWRRV